MVCVRTWKKVTKKDFPTWDEWVKFVNENSKHCREKSTVNDFKGKCHHTDLPSEHPYWAKVVRASVFNTMMRHMQNYKLCMEDSSQIKYLYNLDTSLDDIKEKIDKCKARINEYDRAIRED